MSFAEVTVRRRDGSIVWQQTMDQDSVYFRDFCHNVEVDLMQGWSITIISVKEIECNKGE